MNYRPVFVSEDPSTEMLVDFSITPQQEFSVSVEDMNAGDSLYVRFYIDYDPNNPTFAIAEVDKGPLVNPMPGHFTRQMPPVMLSCNGKRGTGHVISALVSDRQFINDGQPRHIPADALTSEISWAVNCP